MMTRIGKVVLAISAVMILCGAALAQDGRWRGDGDHDRDDRYGAVQNRRGDDGRWYQQGVRDGREDREHNRGYNIRNRRWDDRGDRDAYVNGYRAGYGQGSYRGDRDADRDRRGGYYGNGSHPNNGGYYGNSYPNNGGYGQYGNRGQVGNQAYNTGYQDGLRHGSSDRATGHSYRPTHDDDWNNADRGYNGSFGDKQAYKNQYRSGYQSGYDRGYRSGY